MSDTVIDPSSIAPPGWLRDPDPMGAFAPEIAGDAPPANPIPLAAAQADMFVDDVGDQAADPEPPPAPPRPVVRYLGKGGARGYALLFPIEIDGRRFRSVTVNHPALWDVQDWLAGRIKSHFEFVARMAGLSDDEFGALRWPDVQALLEIAGEMLPPFVRAVIEGDASR
jgi:hypothetical protein